MMKHASHWVNGFSILAYSISHFSKGLHAAVMNFITLQIYFVENWKQANLQLKVQVGWFAEHGYVAFNSEVWTACSTMTLKLLLNGRGRDEDIKWESNNTNRIQTLMQKQQAILVRWYHQIR